MPENFEDPSRGHGVVDQVFDFGKATFHTGLEKPVNAVIQIANHATHSSLPYLEIVGEPTNHSFGTVAGNIAGTALDFYVLSRLGGKALGGLGGAGLAGAALRGAIMGGVFEGVLQPTAAGKENFWSDRLTSGLVGAGTFAAMGVGAAVLDATGRFAVPAARSLLGSMTYGGLSGSLGGLAHAEASAIFKDGRLIPTGAQLTSDLGTYTAFGAAFGAIGWGHERLGEIYRGGPKIIATDSGNITLHTDSEGNPVRFSTRVPALGSSYMDIKWHGSLMTDGSWSSSGYAVMKGGNLPADAAGIPGVLKVFTRPDGSVAMLTDDGLVRSFENGKYSRYGQFSEAKPGDPMITDVRPDGSKAISDEHGVRYVNSAGRTTSQMSFDKKSGFNASYDEQGIKDLSLSGDGASAWFHRAGDGSWEVRAGETVYRWNGTIKPVQNADNSFAEAIEFTPSGGSGTRIGLSGSATLSLVDATGSIKSTAITPQGAKGETAFVTNGPEGVQHLALFADQQHVTFDRVSSDSWKVLVGDRTYTWRGEIKPAKAGIGTGPVAGVRSGAYESYELIPKDGAPQSFSMADPADNVMKYVTATGSFTGIRPDLAAMRMDSEGSIWVRGGTYQRAVVNGSELHQGQELRVTPTDKIQFKQDVGDRYPEWETKDLQWSTTSDGKPILNSKPLKPSDAVILK